MEIKTKKNIAILIDDYFPESTKVAAKMMHELACELYNRGYQVTVFTPKVMKEPFRILSLDGIEVFQFKLGKIKNCSFIKRGINEALLPYKAIKYAGEFCKSKDFDLVINYSPTIFFGPFVNFIKKNSRAKSYLILRDFFPQWIIDNGMIKENSLIARFFRFVENYNYRTADVIGIQSPANISFFQQIHREVYKTRLLYNWADNLLPEGHCSLRDKYNLHGKVIFFYGGNIGTAQDMQNVLRLAKKLESFSDAHFLFVGDGDEVDLVEKAMTDSETKNITYLKSVPQEEFKLFLKEIDVGLFTLNKHHKSHNFPGKILGYMINKIPILGSVNVGNDLKETIEEYSAGYISINGDDEQFYKNALSILESKELRSTMGLNAEKLYHSKFTVVAAVDEILSILEIKG